MTNSNEIVRENEALRRQSEMEPFVLGDDPAQPTYIQNVRAVGYRMVEPVGILAP